MTTENTEPANHKQCPVRRTCCAGVARVFCQGRRAVCSFVRCVTGISKK